MMYICKCNNHVCVSVGLYLYLYSVYSSFFIIYCNMIYMGLYYILFFYMTYYNTAFFMLYICM